MDNGEESAVQDFLEILEEHRKNCERQVRSNSYQQ